MKKTLFMIIALLLCAVNLQAASSAGKDIYVSLETGKNKNNGSKSSPLKNLWIWSHKRQRCSITKIIWQHSKGALL